MYALHFHIPFHKPNHMSSEDALELIKKKMKRKKLELGGRQAGALTVYLTVRGNTHTSIENRLKRLTDFDHQLERNGIKLMNTEPTEASAK